MTASDATFRRHAAMFESLAFPGMHILFTQVGGETDATHKAPVGYVRSSEWVWVDLPSIQVLNSDRLEALSAERRQVEADSAKRLHEIDGRIVQAMAEGAK